MGRKLTRRSVLRGAGGVAVGLPFLEAMVVSSDANASPACPLRFVVMFAGVEQYQQQPQGMGTGYTMPDGLTSLEAVRDDITLVSGMEIPFDGGASTVPPGGIVDFHGHARQPLFTGRRGQAAAVSPFTDPSIDQIVADHIGDETPHRLLNLSAQPEGTTGAPQGISSAGPIGGASEVPPHTNVALAWRLLFEGFTPPAGPPPDDSAVQQSIREQTSVLDLVLDRGKRLSSEVSRSDKVRLEEHFDEIRALEQRIQALSGGNGPGPADGCAPPPEPTDPGGNGGSTYNYAGEEERANVMTDLVHMALTCDLTRVVAYQLTAEGNHMPANVLWGVDNTMHQITHDNGLEDPWREITSWHAAYFTQLVAALRDTPEGDGSVLDNTVLVYTNSGGPDRHQTRDMTLVIAGRPDRIVTGQHVPATGVHPSKLFQTAMAAIDIDQDFGDLPGIISNLLI